MNENNSTNSNSGGGAEKKRPWNALLTALAILAALALAYSLYRTAGIISEYDEGDDAYGAMLEYVVIATPSPTTGVIEIAPPQDAPDSPAPVVSNSPADVSTDYRLSPMDADMDRLIELNPDCVGFIYSPDTRICYPVVQGADNEYYLDRLIDKTRNRNGTLFIDCNNAPDFSDRNTVIYGHNMKSGAMFASINEYKRQSYYDSHPVMYLETVNEKYVIELFAGFAADVSDDCYRFNFGDAEAYMDFINGSIAKSTFASGVTVDPADSIVTLSTCTKSASFTHYVLLGKLGRILP